MDLTLSGNRLQSVLGPGVFSVRAAEGAAVSVPGMGFA